MRETVWFALVAQLFLKSRYFDSEVTLLISYLLDTFHTNIHKWQGVIKCITIVI